METRFGHDFSRVRVHHDGAAARSAAARNASAYTIGEDMYFAAGRYRPDSEWGRRLLAHELAHTIQQEAAARSARADAPEALVDATPERSASDAANRAMDGHSTGVLPQTPLGVARQARAAAGTSGHLAFDSNWSYIVYDAEIRLRYYRTLPKADAEERAKKNLPGFVQVGTIPWITNNPGNITQAPGAADTTLQGYPATLGSLGTYGGRYAIFSSTQAGVGAIAPYLRNLPRFGTNPNLSMAQAIKQYKGEEASEKARRQARERENIELEKQGKPRLPSIDVRETYLADVKQHMKRQMVAAEALEGGEEVEGLTASQRRELEQTASKRIDEFMQKRAADVAPGDADLMHAVQSIYEVEGRAAAPGVSFTCAGFDDPTTSAPYDGEQKGIIKRLRESEAAKDELKKLLGCP